MSLWTPGGPATSEITSQVELHDSDILAIERGPLAWARDQAGKHLNVHQFTEDLKEQFAHIGLYVDIQVWETQMAGAYAFKGEIQRRLGSVFDPDRQVYEVQNNILEIPGQEKGSINTGKAMKEWERERRERGPHRH